MEMGELEGAGERENKRDVFGLVRGCMRGDDVRWWARGNTARERSIVVDIELEEMEERIGYEGDGAVEFVFDAIA